MYRVILYNCTGEEIIVINDTRHVDILHIIFSDATYEEMSMEIRGVFYIVDPNLFAVAKSNGRNDVILFKQDESIPFFYASDFNNGKFKQSFFARHFPLARFNIRLMLICSIHICKILKEGFVELAKQMKILFKDLTYLCFCHICKLSYPLLKKIAERCDLG